MNILQTWASGCSFRWYHPRGDVTVLDMLWSNRLVSPQRIFFLE